MQGSGHNQWVVLLNKMPRGPFSADEIRSLLNQGLLRHNDLALLIQSEVESGIGVWKFLWQYSEFDSRLTVKDPSQIPVAVLEKRQPKNEEQVAQAVKELVPLDLQSIRIEDLIVKASSGVRKELSSLKAGESPATRSTASKGTRFEKIPAISARNLSGMFVLASLLVGGWVGFSKLKVKPEETVATPSSASKSVPEAAAQLPPTGMRAPAGSKMLPQPRNRMQLPTSRLPGPGPGPGAGPGMPPQPGRPPMPAFIPNNVPRERDRGEIREDEIRRMRAEELRREQEEREMQRRRESEEQRQMEEGRETTETTGNPPKSRRPRPAPSDSEGDEEQPLESETESPRGETDEPPPSSWVE